MDRKGRMAALGDRLPVMAAFPLIALKDSRARVKKVIAAAAGAEHKTSNRLVGNQPYQPLLPSSDSEGSR